MITNISRRVTTGALAIAGSVAAFGFGGAAQAATVLAGTLSITGNANIDQWGTTDPMLKPLNVSAVNSATGQFSGVTIADITSIPASFALTGTGTGMMSMFTAPSPLANFISVFVNTAYPVGPGSGTVIGDITSSVAYGTFVSNAGGSTTSYGVMGNMLFKEPNGYPNLLGTYNITFTRSVDSIGQISQSYALSLQKSGVTIDIPEPSAILGILAVAGVGAFSRRKS
ncbi:MAG: PEP-CTERM sorting domain-containing protein [Microcystis sp. M54BS1]|uniref:PEP-CTERM sorting domain-containing protein n=1 Tax=unclassified Microcystis TaxID=2643300 RepID=UPI00257F8209|nr:MULTISPECIES: PEP-CTERM sorting domain-containing protein [unclassified Microcystis]MCA2538000.1 PEP-CTERM sorting domain-containing protein [Microcystis sp. M54BS1]MCA2597286.1 PEP-CTERM sorting domain-containing protein [Microcystis sp. M38BS1]MCA2612274.1 PEP-CTERM sorting domain-containing protein [Microcystis sp. M27BS1]MCA2504190.1 PEP-CTERM sorting domain-containing protein [Microcystis sp. M62BS1]MCA2512390.1 PEP-CTERM sorting domain-containing protein [Microcystis sp. M60BS1]